jgi:F-type H+-transporting ATPase subunit gamma
MAGKTRELRRRMGAVRAIQRITKTMQMIATAKFTAAQQRARASKPYAERLAQLAAETLAAAGEVDHPLVRAPAPAVRRQRILVVSSNRGLCGAYNGNVLRVAIGAIRELRQQGVEVDLETAGKKGAGYFRFQRIPIARRHDLGDQPRYEQVEEMAERYIQDFCAGGLDSVSVVHMQFVSASRQVPRVLELLPLRPAAVARSGTGAAALSEFTPSLDRLVGEMLPLTLKSALHQAFLDGAVSEQIMRMIAMRAATDNARDLGRLLTRSYNRARQSQITTELMEVVGGAVALE